MLRPRRQTPIAPPLVALLTATTLAACSPSQVTPAAPGPDLPDEATLVYRLEGGIAGLSLEWTVRENGDVVATGQDEAITRRLGSATAAWLAEQVRRLDSLSAHVDTDMPEGSADLFRHQVVFRRGDGTGAVQWWDGGDPDDPESLDYARTFRAVADTIRFEPGD